MSTKKAGETTNLACRTLRELKIGIREGFPYAFNCSWSNQTIFPLKHFSCLVPDNWEELKRTFFFLTLVSEISSDSLVVKFFVRFPTYPLCFGFCNRIVLPIALGNVSLQSLSSPRRVCALTDQQECWRATQAQSPFLIAEENSGSYWTVLELTRTHRCHFICPLPMTRLESLHCFHIIYHSDNITNPKGVELQEKKSHKLFGGWSQRKKKKIPTPTLSNPNQTRSPSTQKPRHYKT